MKRIFRYMSLIMCVMTFSIVGCEDDLETGNNGSINGHDYVDLGLPSGTKWATCNVGATIPEEYGNYYARDESSTKWGGSWRIPTKEEMKELMQNCIWKWTTQNNVNGYKVTSSNGNSIFLPAAGYQPYDFDYDCYTGIRDVGKKCMYWSSTPSTYSGCMLYASSGIIQITGNFDEDKLSVRLVSD